MAVCGGKCCAKRKQCKNYEGNYLKYHNKNDSNNWAQYVDWSTNDGGSMGIDGNGNIFIHGEYSCGDFSKIYPLFDEIEIDHEKLKLIDQAIESAQCRIYRLKANPGSTEAHQKKAENQVELMKITTEALEYYKNFI